MSIDATHAMARAMATRPKEVNDPGVCATNSGTWKQQANEVKVHGFLESFRWVIPTAEEQWHKMTQVPCQETICIVASSSVASPESGAGDSNLNRNLRKWLQQHNMTSNIHPVLPIRPSIQGGAGSRGTLPEPGGRIWSWKLWIRFKADGKTPKTNKS